MEKSFDAQTTCRQHGWGTGKSPHGQHSIGPAGFEKQARRTPRLPEAAQESEAAAPLQRNRRKGDDLQTVRGFHCLLVHFLRRNQQGDRTAARTNFASDGQPGKR